MKKLGVFALLLSLGMFTLGCEKPKDGAADTATPDTTEAAPDTDTEAAPE